MRMFSREYGALESQHAIPIGVVNPKNRFPFESIACAVASVPLLPISTKDRGTLSALASHIVELSKTLSRTAFSVMPANEWKYNVRPLPVGPWIRNDFYWSMRFLQWWSEVDGSEVKQCKVMKSHDQYCSNCRMCSRRIVRMAGMSWIAMEGSYRRCLAVVATEPNWKHRPSNQMTRRRWCVCRMLGMGRRVCSAHATSDCDDGHIPVCRSRKRRECRLLRWHIGLMVVDPARPIPERMVCVDYLLLDIGHVVSQNTHNLNEVGHTRCVLFGWHFVTMH